jgi:uncharacterized protein
MNTTPQTHDTIDYPAMIDDAMRGVVRTSLQQVLKHGLPGSHHFYISFDTNAQGVRISPQIHDRFPQEMTIVIQHQFWDLQVHEHYFSVMLSFNNIPEKLVIPYAAMTAFADPSIKFGLQFHNRPSVTVPAAAAARPTREPDVETSFDVADDEPVVREEPQQEQGAEIISLDAFRKK